MAKRDVELVVRAKNEASRALDAITESERRLTEANAKLAASAGKVGSSFDDIGSDAAKLKAQISGLESLGSVVAVFDRAASGLTRLKEEVSETGIALARLKADFATATSVSGAASEKVKAAAQALKALREEGTKAKQEQSAVNASVRSAQSAYDALASRVAKATTPNQELTASLKKQGDALAILKDKQSSVAASHENVKNKIVAQTQEYKALVAAESAAKTNASSLGASIDQTSKSLEKSTANLSTANAEFKELTAVATKASSALGGVALSQDAVAAASARAAAQLGQARQNLNFQKFANKDQDKASVQANFSKFESSVGDQTSLGRFKAALSELKSALTGVDTGFSKASGGAGIFRRALTAITGETRQALGVVERLRGQVLSLAAGYVGFFAAVQQIGGVITAFRAVEAAQNRLGAALKQNSAQTAEELRFLNQQATRLGVSFGTLADEYSKFVVAGQAANFTLEGTRKIFLSVAEAGRVNKLTNEQISGTFLALTQSISKGKIQSEELRRQLGDRLPGAFVLMAKALNVTTAELDAMLEKGQVLATESNMLAFARVLNEEFGGQLPSALKSLTTEIGRFENSIFQAQARVAQGGFAESLRENLEKLNTYFDSRAGRDFFLQLGAALGQATNLIGFFVDNIGAISTAFKVLLSYKAAQFIFSFYQQLLLANPALATMLSSQVALTGATGLLTRAKVAATGAVALFGRATATSAGFVTLLRGGMTASGAAAAVFTGGMRAATVAVSALTTVMRAVPLLAFAAGITLLVSYFTDVATEVPTATTALDEHERIIGKVAQAYREAEESGGDFLKKVKDVSSLEASSNFEKLLKERNTANAELREYLSGIEAVSTPAVRTGNSADKNKILDLLKAYSEAAITATELNVAMEQINKTSKDPSVRALIVSVYDKTKAFQALEKATDEAAVVAEKFGDKSDAVREVVEKTSLTLDSLAGAAGDVSTAFDNTAALDKYKAAITELTGKVPELKAELEKLNNLSAINSAFNDAANNARSVGQFFNAEGLRNAAVDAETQKAVFSAIEQAAKENGVDDAVLKLIAFLESGFRSNAKNPTSSAGGLFQQIDSNAAAYGVKDRFNALESAQGAARFMRDNIRLLEQAISRAPTPAEIYLAHQQGAGGAIKLLTNPTKNAASLVGKNAVTLNGGDLDDTAAEFVAKWTEKVNRAVRSGRGKIDAKLEDANNKPGDEENAKKAEEAKKRVEEQKEFNAEIQKKIDLDKFEVANLAETARQQAINRAITEAEIAAKEKGLVLSKQQKDAIAESAAARFDAENKDKLASEERKKIEEDVNRLIAMRQELLEQIKVAEESGNTDKAGLLKGKLDETNVALTEAIAKAQEFYAKMGGPEADLASLKLDGVKTGLQTVKQSLIDTKQLTGDFVNGLVGAFDGAAQAVAGFLDGTLSAKDAMRGLRDAFLKFAADFLRQMAQMIIKRALLNALEGAGGGGGGGGFFGFLTKIFHEGGVAGQSGGQSRAANPAWFANARRMHGGGIAGLRAKEIPTILEEGEEVLKRNDPRHRFNGGGAGAPAAQGNMNVRVVNTFDPVDYLEQALQTPQGERLVLNMIRNNSGAVQSSLG